MESEWTRGDWSQARQVIDRLSSQEVDHALETLRYLYPPDWVNSRGKHPVAAKQHMWPGRVALIEVGHAASFLAVETESERLREPEEFPSVLSELRTALMVSRSGASVRRPAPRAHTKNFEFLAEYSSGEALAFEVKTPRAGENHVLFERLETSVLFALMRRLPIPQSLRARVTIHFERTIAEIDEFVLLQRCIADAESRVRRALESGEFAKLELGPIGWIEIQLDEACDRLQFDAIGVGIDENVEGRRVRRSVLNKAAQQLSTSEHAGVVVIDLGLNRVLRNAIPFLERWTMGRPQLAGMLLIERHFFGLRMYDGVDVLPGPRFAEARSLLRAFEVCSSRHVHYCALCSPIRPCPCDRWFRRIDSVAGGCF